MSETSLSLKRLFVRFRFRILATWFLVVAEAALSLLLPLLMGIAIDDMLENKSGGLFWLGLVGFMIIIAGAARRFYDTRIYSHLYTRIADEVVLREQANDSAVSVISARTGMASELIEFLENSFPAIINCVIALVGTLLIVGMLQPSVFVGCVIATVLIGLLFAITSSKTYLLNQGYNDEVEKRVDVLSANDQNAVTSHFKRSMRWNIRLSDLETVNFSISWAIMIGVIVFSVWAAAQDSSITRGTVLSLLMYVFEYIESVVAIPFFYQQFVRLQEITHRLESTIVPAEAS